jgi:uncharacterized membrane protein HdeD (DUF308 family)
MSEFAWAHGGAEGLERASSRWWLFLLLGTAAAIVGLILMFDIFAAVRTLAFLAAFGLIFTGLDEVIAAGRYRSILGMVAGGVLVLGGIVAMAWPGITLWALAVIAGLAMLLSGVVRLVGALSDRGEGWIWILGAGVLSIAAGVVALAWPNVTILVLGLLLGIRMLLFGLAEIAYAFALREARAGV